MLAIDNSREIRDNRRYGHELEANVKGANSNTLHSQSQRERTQWPGDEDDHEQGHMQESKPDHNHDQKDLHVYTLSHSHTGSEDG